MSEVDPCVDLRERLLDMRADLVTAMIAGGFSSSMGALLTGINAALDALDAVHGSLPKHESGGGSATTSPDAPAHPAPAARAVIQNEGGSEVRLVIFDGADTRAAVMLDSARATELAGELIAAAHRRLAPGNG